MTTRRAILTALDRVTPYLIPEQSLWVDVNAQMAKPITISVLRADLQRLETERLIISIASSDPEEPDPKWRITDTGRGALAATI